MYVEVDYTHDMPWMRGHMLVTCREYFKSKLYQCRQDGDYQTHVIDNKLRSVWNFYHVSRLMKVRDDVRRSGLGMLATFDGGYREVAIGPTFIDCAPPTNNRMLIVRHGRVYSIPGHACELFTLRSQYIRRCECKIGLCIYALRARSPLPSDVIFEIVSRYCELLRVNDFEHYSVQVKL